MVVTDFIWVVGTKTGVGKTTIARAAIVELTRLGTPCAGFKPMGVLRLRGDLDFIRHELPHGKLYGPDVPRLSRVSPVTPDDLAEVVSPCYYLVFQSVGQTLVLRTGSAEGGGRTVRASAASPELLGREDVQEILSTHGLPVPADGPRDPTAPGQAYRVFAREIASAAELLVMKGARTIVCEGAGAFFPVWPGYTRPKHIFVVEPHAVHLLTGISPFLDRHLATQRAPRLANAPAFGRAVAAEVRTLPIPVACAADVDSVVGRVVSHLMDAAGFTGGGAGSDRDGA